MKYQVIVKFIVEAVNGEDAKGIISDKLGDTKKYYKTMEADEYIEKPTIEQIIQHYKQGVGTECLVCDKELSGGFTDAQGQIRCTNCGTTYQINGCHLASEFLEKNGVEANQIAQKYCDIYEYTPLLKLYWNEFHKRVPFGVYNDGGNITNDEIDSFYGWLVQNAKRFENVYTGFSWEALKLRYD